jgi:hypothetical protein
VEVGKIQELLSGYAGLGLIGPRDGIQPIWNYYHFFKNEYAHETFDQGPLLALYEMKDRFSLVLQKEINCIKL